jgi:hypothetical protein
MFDNDARWADSLGVEIRVAKLYTGFDFRDPGPCPLQVEFLDGNPSRTGSYPRFARVTCVSDRPHAFIRVSSASPADPYSILHLSICNIGEFPRHMDFRVEQEGWGIRFEEGKLDSEPTPRERWLWHRQTYHYDMSFEGYLATVGTPNTFHLSSMATTAPALGINGFLIPWGAQPLRPSDLPPAAPPKPNVFEMGKKPRRLQGETK